MHWNSWRWIGAGTVVLLVVVGVVVAFMPGDEPTAVVVGDTDSAPVATGAPTPTATSAPAPASNPEPDSATDPTATPAATALDDTGVVVAEGVVEGEGCILYLHGAGTEPGFYDEPWAAGIRYLAPHSGNPDQPWFWLYDGPHNTEYDPGDSTEPYDELVDYLTDYLDSNECGPTMLYGASSGGGFAARIYCSGEDFGGRMWGVLVDDPVPDAGVVGCSPSPTVQRTLFVHSTELVETAATFVDDRCSQSPVLQWPWYCQDDTGFDLEEYEAHIGQTSVWGRELHSDRNTDETNFWKINLSWWYDFDPVTYAELEGR